MENFWDWVDAASVTATAAEESWEQAVPSTAASVGIPGSLPSDVASSTPARPPSPQTAICVDDDAPLACTAANSPSNCKRKWTTEERLKHSTACQRKDRLTLADKLQIIYLHSSAPATQRKNQVRVHRACIDEISQTMTTCG